nr:piggyBac transposable element-derived protein 4-like [Onthophagus taurus]
MSYEKEQARLKKLWKELLSDEESEANIFDGDEIYEPLTESSESEDDYRSKSKRLKKNNCTPSSQKPEPSTSQEIIESPNYMDEIIEEVIRNMRYDDLGDEENNNDIEKEANNQSNELEWVHATGKNLKNLQFSVPNSDFNIALYEQYDKLPYDFFKVFVNDDIISLIVEETNRYAEQCKRSNILPNARILKWTPTDPTEIEHFIGIILWMGLWSFPALSAYWSTKRLYKNAIPSVMSTNRIQLLLKMIHFSNNEEISDDKLQKITPLVNKLRTSFQCQMTPSEYVCIDETLVPFRGRLKFRQYISNKRHKFGIKLFKLCLKDGYTYDFQVYCGKSKDGHVSVLTKVVMDLMTNILDSGRILCTDNYYTSVSLANALLHRKTHLIGTLRSNRKYNPKRVVDKKLKVGEVIAEECKQGIVVEKWRDKRDVLILSTRYGNEMVPLIKRGKEIQKPKNMVEYNKYKSNIDISDQLKSYNTCLRRSMKWYRKLAFELLTGSAIVNAYIAYKEITNNKISITAFKEEVINGLLKTARQEETSENMTEIEHKLEDVDRSKRRRCVICYKKISNESGREQASRKT